MGREAVAVEAAACRRRWKKILGQSVTAVMCGRTKVTAIADDVAVFVVDVVVCRSVLLAIRSFNILNVNEYVIKSCLRSALKLLSQAVDESYLQ